MQCSLVTCHLTVTSSQVLFTSLLLEFVLSPCVIQNIFKVCITYITMLLCHWMIFVFILSRNLFPYLFSLLYVNWWLQFFCSVVAEGTFLQAISDLWSDTCICVYRISLGCISPIDSISNIHGLHKNIQSVNGWDEMMVILSPHMPSGLPPPAPIYSTLPHTQTQMHPIHWMLPNVSIVRWLGTLFFCLWDQCVQHDGNAVHQRQQPNSSQRAWWLDGLQILDRLRKWVQQWFHYGNPLFGGAHSVTAFQTPVLRHLCKSTPYCMNSMTGQSQWLVLGPHSKRILDSRTVCLEFACLHGIPLAVQRHAWGLGWLRDDPHKTCIA